MTLTFNAKILRNLSCSSVASKTSTMAFQELMKKNNLLGGKYGIEPPRTSPPAPSCPASPTAIASQSKRKRSNVVSSNVVLPQNGRINTTSGFMVLEDEQTGPMENVDERLHQDMSELLERHTKQRRMAERLQDPIVVRKENRKEKTNLNSFKSKYLTLKKKVSALQMEVGTEPDFLLIIKNNLQDPNVGKPSKMAGKYMCFGGGSISDLFIKSGIKFNSTHMYQMENNYNYMEKAEKEDNLEVETNSEPHSNASEAPKTVSNVGKNQQTKTVKTHRRKIFPSQSTSHVANYRPIKVFTPGSNFLDNLSGEEDEDDDEEQEPVTVQETRNQDKESEADVEMEAAFAATIHGEIDSS